MIQNSWIAELSNHIIKEIYTVAAFKSRISDGKP